ncbi:MAG TPA: preprotein translocase subunit YajC [Gemmatimonadaceae bacterium]|nr:preprotein translocase subunit YajC [Gemmatimonadaceae bacterium]
MNSATNPIAPQLIMYAAIFLIFYLVLLRPQQQQRKKHEASLKAVKKGDEVVTGGGVIGEIVHIKTAADGGASDTDRITIRSGESRFIIERRGISRVITPAVQEAKTPASGGTA